MTPTELIARFRKLVSINPNDEMAQFGLGTALLEAGQAAEAGPCFQRVLALSSQNSKAYELLGAAQKAAGQTALAIQTLTDGYRIAQRKGDAMPLAAMGVMLGELGAPIPTVAAGREAPAAGAAEGGFRCRRCGAGGPPLKERPFRGELGEQILASVCQSCWSEWVRMGTKVINELRLPLNDPQAQAMYDQHMKEFLLLE